MKKVISILFILQTFIASGQTSTEPYRFSQDLLKQIDSDTTPWKFQIGATELSFNNRYKEVMEAWDKLGIRKPKSTEADSLLFVKSKKISAKDYIIGQSKSNEIIIINEAHHVAQHRTFTTSLLKGLYENGYRYLGLEALADSLINERRYPILESGYYTKEPEFGNLLSEALKLGFTLFGYEASPGKNGKEREIEQTENIQKFIESNPPGKVLIHCGYAHAFENDYPAWEKAMARRLKENLNVDPLTIDQTMFLERSKPENNHLFMRLNRDNQPVVLMGEDGQIFNGLVEPKQTDIVVIHPETNYINNRPYWLTQNRIKHTVKIPKSKRSKPVLVLAYRTNEFENNGIPADIIEITDESSPKDLFLTKGSYWVVIKDRNYNIVEKYAIRL